MGRHQGNYSDGSVSGLFSRRILRDGKLIAALTLLLSGCVGAISGLGGASGNGGAGDQSDLASELVNGRLRQRIWRLTPSEFAAEMSVLFGSQVPDLGNLPEGSPVNGFTNGAAGLMVDETTSSATFYATEDYAGYVADNAATLVQCEGATVGSRECAQIFLSSLASRAYRRPVESSELDALMALYDNGATDDFATGIKVSVHAVLNSPFFLYRTEIGDAATQNGDERKLTQYEIASMLSFIITGHSPDQELLNAAQNGELYDAAVRTEHARRLFESSSEVWGRFALQWLDLGRLDLATKQGELYPQFSEQLVEEMRQETQSFVQNIFVEQKGSFVDLFTASYTWTTPALADIYGATHPGSGLAKIDLDPSTRSGVLTQLSWLTNFAGTADSSLERRGLFVWRNLICNVIPPPPAGAAQQQASLVAADASKEEIVLARAATPTCNGCHQVMDPIGMGLENYGALGEYRDQVDGNTVNPVGTIPDFGSFTGAVELSATIAQDPTAQACFSQRFAQYVLGSDLGSPNETDWLNSAHESFLSHTTTIEELLVGLVAHEGFIERNTGGS
ncbi:MAG: DUF1592 domain-containing protein [Myxococcales bacterium]|nr:MAG: DUF1592 domain-containing protein [Myxococcales bacterium]